MNGVITRALAYAATLLLLATGTPAVAQSCVPPPPGILAWWPLDETSGTVAQDIAGNHPAAYFGAVASGPGMVGAALHFSGGFLAAADSDSWAFGARGFTIELWASFDGPVGGSVDHPGAIFIGNDEGPGGLAKWFFAVGGGDLNFHINGPAVPPPKFLPLVPFSPQPGRWYHLAVTRDGALYTLFVDGAPAGSAVNGISIPDPSAPLTIGQAESLGFLRGRLDEITVYNRALTPAEIQAIASAGGAGKCKSLAPTSVTPAVGGDIGEVTVRVTGGGFATGTAVSLRRTGQPDIDGKFVAVDADGGALSAVFDLTGRLQGTWDVVITASDGTSRTLRQAFTIEAGRAAQPWVLIVGRGAVRAGTPAQYQVIYGNRGNVDAHWVPLVIAGIPPGATFQLGPEVTPPPIPGLEQVDWTTVPVNVTTPQGTFLPLLISEVAPGTPSTLPLTLTVPAGPPFDLSAAVGPDASPKASATIRCGISLLNLFFDASGLLPAGACFKELADFAKGSLVALVNDDVHVHRKTLWSETQLFVGLAFAFGKTLTPCAVALGKNLTFWVTIGQLVFDGKDFLETFNDCLEALIPLLDSVDLSILEVRRPTSLDPNDLVGASGFGLARYLAGAVPLPYEAIFENVATATAPVQQAVVTDRLDPAVFDLTTLSLGPIRLGGRTVVPPPGSKTFATTVDLRPGQSLLVNVEANLDSPTGTLTWKFASIDPATGQPPADPLVGFLPPNVHPPEGEGSVLFTVLSRAGLATGTVARDQAVIVFDANPPLATPVWSNVLDNTPPVSRCLPLAPAQAFARFPVQWSGGDLGAGIRDFSVFVSENKGPFRLWLRHTTATKAAFTGRPGSFYGFYAVARDLTENSEAAHPTWDTITRVLQGAPLPH